MSKAKKILALSACLLVGAGVLAGCGGGGEPAPAPSGDDNNTSTQTVDIDSKVLDYGVTAYSGAQAEGGIDPHLNYAGWSTVRYGIGECLVKISEEGTIESWLAEKWEPTDATTWTITIKDNVTFSNGKKVDAAAVKACFERLVEKNVRAEAALLIESMEANGQVLTIKTKEANPVLINYLTDPFACIIDVSGEVNGSNNLIGTGPYLLESATTDKVVVKANKNYWNGTPKIGTINVHGFLDGDTMAMALQNNELDVCANLSYNNMQLFKDNSDYEINSASTSRSYMFMFNTKDEALQDVNVRKAVTMAIDKQSFVNTLLSGYGSVAELLYPESYTFGDSKLDGPDYDVDAAKQLLANAGWTDTDGDGYVDKDGKMFELNWVTYRNRQELPMLAEFAQASLKNIGIKVNINDSEGNVSVDQIPADFDIYAWAIVTAPYADTASYMNQFLTGYNNHCGWSGENFEKFKALYEKLVPETDPEKRAQYGVEMQQLMIDDSVLCVVSHNVMNIVSRTANGVEGLAPHPSDYYEITVDTDIAK